MSNPLLQLSLGQAASALKRKDFSSVELTQAYLDRIESVDPKLGAYIFVAKESAMEAARESDRRLSQGGGQARFLEGCPIALKDIFVTKGIRTTCGSKILGNYIPPYEGTPSGRLKDSGAVLLGKLNMDEFAMGSSNENSALGPVRNPWDIERVPGGSSGGSAAAVAANLCLGTLGTDTGGSIRQPAAFCGIVGLRPTYGRVSRYGVIAFASSLDQVGPMAQNVEDTALILKAIAGHDPMDSTSAPVPVPDYVSLLNQDIKGKRLGVPKEFFGAGLDAEVKDAVLKAIADYEHLGAKIEEISLPHMEYAIACYYIIAPSEASSNLARYDGVRYGVRCQNPEDLRDLYFRSRSEGFGDEVKRRIMLGTYCLSAGYYDAYYKKAQQVRALIRDDFNKAYEKVDAIVTPTTPSTAFKLGERLSDPLTMYLADVFTVPANLAGIPGLSLPCGRDSKGLPIGLQLLGKPFKEEELLAIAHAYEQATPWHTARPEV